MFQIIRYFQIIKCCILLNAGGSTRSFSLNTKTEISNETVVITNTGVNTKIEETDALDNVLPDNGGTNEDLIPIIGDLPPTTVDVVKEFTAEDLDIIDSVKTGDAHGDINIDENSETDNDAVMIAVEMGRT